MHNTMKLHCVYWTLLFISFVSSGLLFLIVASEGSPGPVFKIKNKHELLDNITLEDAGKNNDEILETLNVLNSDFQLGLNEKTDAGNIYSTNKDSVNNDESLAATGILQSNNLNVLKESVSQQPNLSQGISQTGQAVVLTLVDTATTELQNLAQPHLSSNTRAQDSTRNLSQSSISSDEIDSVIQIPASSVSTLLLPIDDSNTSNSDGMDQIIEDIETVPEEDGVLVIRAVQKPILDISNNFDNAITKTNDRNAEINGDFTSIDAPVSSSAEFDNEAARSKLVSGSSGEETPVVILDVLGNSGTVEHHEDIPSFSEWAQKRLEEAEKKKTHPNASIQNPGGPGRGVGGMKVRSKNYASPDCGAKIVAVNPEARSARSVLVSTRDEYMLNTCTSRIWFVVELCEAIQAKKIDLANFELFSSSPKDFSVFVNDRFPTRDWSHVGHFTAKDERDIQSFTLHPHLFGKFMKIELHSHYGSEHFCPISLFRAYGTSEFEVLETETDVQETSDIEDNNGDNDNNDDNEDDDDIDDDDDDNDDDDNGDGNDEGGGKDNDDGSVGVDGVGGVGGVGGDDGDNDDNGDNDDEDDDDEEILDGDDCEISKNLFGSARDVVIRIVKKAAAVLVKTGNLDANNITKIQESIEDNIKSSFANCMTPRYIILCNNCTDDHFAKVFHLISCQNSHLDSIIKISFIKHALHRSELCAVNGVDLNTDGTNFHNKNQFVKKSSCTQNLPARFLSSILPAEYIVAVCNGIATRERRLVVNSSNREVTSISTNNAPSLEVTTVKSVVSDCTMIPQISVTCIADVASCQITANSFRDTKRFAHDGSIIKEGALHIAIKDTKLPNLLETFRTTESLASQIKPTKTFNKGNHKRESSAPILEPSKDTAEETIQAKVVTTPSPLSNSMSTTIKVITEPSPIGTSIETVTQTIISQLHHIDNYENSNVDTVTMNVEVGMEKSKFEGGIRVEGNTEKFKEKDDENIKLTAQEQLSLESLLSDLKDLEGDSHGQSNSASTVTPLAASTTPQQRESVFLRLSNRIKALEQNMSLSGQYLEELSRRYKKQVEEMQRSLERTTAAFGEELRKSEERESKRLEEIGILREELSNLSESIEILLYDRNNWKSKLSSFGQHIALIIVEIAVLVSIISYCRRSNDLEEAPMTSKIAIKNVPIRRKSTESMDRHPITKNKKRRPSEIASVIKGTYRDLMIDDKLELKKERKKRRKKELLIGLQTNITTDRDVPHEIIASRRSSSIDCRNAREIKTYYSDRWPNSAPDCSYHWQERQVMNNSSNENVIGANCVIQNRITVDKIDENIDVRKSETDDTTDQHQLSANIHEFKRGISRCNSPKRNLVFFNNAQFNSPFFMKTALRSRSKHDECNGKDKHSETTYSDNCEWHSRTSESSRSGQDSPSSSIFLNSPNSDSHNNVENPTNGHYSISDDSGSGNTTPISARKMKKESSLRKMVRKLF